MRYRYCQLEENYLVLCAAPEGAVQYRPAFEAIDLDSRVLPAIAAGWVPCGDRIAILRNECEANPADRMRLIRKVADALPEGTGLRDGVLGIALVGQCVQHQEKTFQYLSFFHLPSLEAWEASLPSYTRAEDLFLAGAPEGFPTEAQLQLFDFRLRRFPMLE